VLNIIWYCAALGVLKALLVSRPKSALGVGEGSSVNTSKLPLPYTRKRHYRGTG
jgi:hypothetical protein